MEITSYTICALFGYLLGGINPAYLIAKWKGFDIRTRGSGNAGASNAVIVMGKKAGALSAAFDILKAYAAFRLMAFFFPHITLAGEVAGASCILGHIFPVFMKFHGGKGLATLGGVILAYDGRVFFFLIACELVLVLLVDYICIVPMTGSAAFTILYWFTSGKVFGTVLFAVVTAVINFKHIQNIKRIMSGKEAHLSFLWKRDSEIARLQENENAKH